LIEQFPPGKEKNGKSMSYTSGIRVNKNINL